MTIKQQGGIFGRNPTFNDVTVDGTLTSASASFDALDNTPIGSTTPSTGDFTTITGEAVKSGYIADFRNTRSNQDAGGLYVQTRYNNSVNSILKLATNSGTATALEVRGNLDMDVYGSIIMKNAGEGIDFSATSGTGTSELFSDYEEGIFTPSIIGSASAGTGTYAYQIGRYTKIGDRVLFNLIMSWSAHTGTGFMRIDGLPFTSMASSPYYHAVNIGYIDNITTTAGTVPSGFIPNNSTQIWMGQIPTGGGAWSYMGIDTAGDINISGQYEV